MESTRNLVTNTTLQSIWPDQWTDRRTLFVLFFLALFIRLWVMWAIPIPARDSISFIRIALLLEEQPWGKVFRNTFQHPGYSITIWAMARPMQWVFGRHDSLSMQFSAQMASMLAGLFLILPMYYLGKIIFGRSVGFWAALLFQYIPATGYVLSDAISDPLFLLMGVSGMLFGVLAINSGQVNKNIPIETSKSKSLNSGSQMRAYGTFALCGVFAGLAYLVRPEGILVVVAVAITAVGLLISHYYRMSWRRIILGVSLMVVMCVIVGSPYFLSIGKISNKPSVSILTTKLQKWMGAEKDQEITVGKTLVATHINTDHGWQRRSFESLFAVGKELGQCFFYVGCIPLFLGLYWCSDRYRAVPGTWLVLLMFLIQLGVVWCLAMAAGYVSSRHVMIAAACCIYQVIAVTIRIPYRMHSLLFNNTTSGSRIGRFGAILFQPKPWIIALFVGVMFVGMIRLFRPLHANRDGHLEAGKWLATHAKSTDIILDDHLWAHYYAGRVLYEVQNPTPIPTDENSKEFVVIARTSQRTFALDDSQRIAEERLIQQGGKIVYQWPRNAEGEKIKVIIYQLPKIVSAKSLTFQ